MDFQVRFGVEGLGFRIQGFGLGVLGSMGSQRGSGLGFRV